MRFIRNKASELGLKSWAVYAAFGFAAIVLLWTPWFLLQPAGAGSLPADFEVQTGEGFRHIAGRLAAEHIIRSQFAFEVYAVMMGAAREFKPGIYQFSPALSSPSIIARLVSGIDREAEVTIPEGSSIYDIDSILSAAGIFPQGEFITLAKQHNLEGELFPDTYRFYLKSSDADIFQKFSDNFKKHLAPILPADPALARQVLIMASILEKEVQTAADQKIVAGILWKRLKAGMPLQADATICYAKRAAGAKSCYPLTALDTAMESPYNTYLNRGLPPGPIGNPGVSAVLAALSPTSTPYWFYLTDPVTHQTIFAKTLAEQEANRAKYLTQSTH